MLCDAPVPSSLSSTSAHISHRVLLFCPSFPWIHLDPLFSSSSLFIVLAAPFPPNYRPLLSCSVSHPFPFPLPFPLVSSIECLASPPRTRPAHPLPPLVSHCSPSVLGLVVLKYEHCSLHCSICASSTLSLSLSLSSSRTLRRSSLRFFYLSC